ncbi:hypothetical protein DL767_007346 [Monosporascus sp. MG133]|nr:hypothetical protein DL767_007346 [Monosporascus sp. MG133]
MGRRRNRGRRATGASPATKSNLVAAVSQSASSQQPAAVPADQPENHHPQHLQNGGQRQAKPATNQRWGRVGTRELGALLLPDFLDSSYGSSSSSEEGDEEEEGEDSTDADGAFEYDGSYIYRDGVKPGPSTPRAKRLTKAYVKSTFTPGHKRSLQQQPKSTKAETKSTPRKERALRRELLRRQLAVREANPLDENEDEDDNGDDYSNHARSHRFDIRAKMASQQGKWREDQVLVICPGSQTTMAQLGCSELTPPAHRIPTRMFRDEDGTGYLPYHTYKRKKTTAGGRGAASAAATNEMPDAGDAKPASVEDDYEFVEDRDSVEGAIYPIQGGRIVNMEAFLAFLDHVHSLLTTTYHNTPIMLMASPQWTRPDCESIARYIFEKTKTPALCLLHSAVAAQYGLKWPTMTVVDIGFEKVDVTCIYDYNVVNHKNLGFPTPVREISGGEVFTQKLLALLKHKGFTYEMAEQLKKSPLCEVLAYAGDLPELMELPKDDTAAADGPQIIDASTGDNDDTGVEAKEGEDGVLDVANIVTSGNTREFLAKKEKEKAEKAKLKKGKGQEPEPSAAKPGRLPNSKRKFNIFHYEELVHEDVLVPTSNGSAKTEQANPAPTNSEATATEGAPSIEEAKPEANTEAQVPAAAAASAGSVMERRTRRVRKDIEVGLERFLFADRGEIDRIVETIYRTVQGIDDAHKRTACWDNIVFVGNGSRLRGLKENVMQTLQARHLVSPSTATIFTSELPSNVATPSGTGSQTPTGSYTGPVPTAGSVNPLLQAATMASSMGVVPGQQPLPGGPTSDLGIGAGPHAHTHAHHGQTPMSIKLAALPTYLAEWTKNGFEEAMFLGSLVAARLAYCIHNLDAQGIEAQRMMSLNRVDYNELGPKAVRTHSMLG